MKIRTEYVYPPVPFRNADWSAVDDDTYDGAEDSNCPIGRGATERDAINDLVAQLVSDAYDDGYSDGVKSYADDEAQERAEAVEERREYLEDR